MTGPLMKPEAGAASLLSDVERDAELVALAADAMGWLPLAEGAYLHAADPRDEVITVVGVAEPEMAGMNVLLLLG
ncbi:hypothetical protein EDC62_0841 [Tibeticola sediminis]|jgi:hypothetical protein|uniref:Uncharacterized protein n=2 Tax=Tibeticola sediminis TaxID=1917811 RepID=A0A3N4VGV2_9BURK|nr:hypothetical protein EDC62_0841 [Tibeticola sediminis]